MGRSGRIVLAAINMFLVSAVASAQVVQNSTIAGVVRDPSGAVLPGVTVEAASPALIERVRAAVTDGQGQYKVIDLRPGIYTVTFALPGFSTVKREGLELPPNFTASVNIELRVGSLEETVTVTGESPVVDVQNVSHRDTFSRAMLDTVPTSKSQLGYAALVPAAITPPNYQDVGGSKGEATVRMTIHGAKQFDQKLLLDGMRYNNINSNGTGRVFFVNPAGTQDVVVQLGSGGSAEYSTGGVQVNLVPKDGGNRFNAYFFTTFMNDRLQGDNLTSDLQARGLRTVNRVRYIFDVNGAFGGPLKRDKLWFHTAHRYWGNGYVWANQFLNADPSAFTYTPDLNRPTEPWEWYVADNLRLTWQASAKDRVSFYVDRQRVCQCLGSSSAINTGTTAFEATTALVVDSDELYQFSWTHPVSSRLLLEAGSTILHYDFRTQYQEGVSLDTISVLEQTTGYRYRAPAGQSFLHPGQNNHRFAMSYVTGSHNFKTGFFLMEGGQAIESSTNSASVNYTFRSGVPVQLTQYARPLRTYQRMRPELGLYAQDQWTVKRLTLNAGLRFEYFRAFVPASEQPATLFVDARSFSEVNCVPCWKDINPRVGVSYDLFGSGKTALKGSVGRYISTQTTDIAAANDPANTSVNQVDRSWTDTDRDLIPDCNLRDTEANGECGAMLNKGFGKLAATSRYDPELINGWFSRPFNWQASVEIEHELLPGMAVSAGYFRTWFGNFTVTDNEDVTPRDFDPYCITAPTNPRLPGGGGHQICGLYNLNPAKVGQVHNLVTFAKNYGAQTEIYNGVDLNFSARLPRGAQLAGGLNIGNAISSAAYDTFSSGDRCYVVDSPQELYQCDQHVPYQPRLKVNGSYPLPGDLRVSANFQTLPGAPIPANYPAPNSLIAPTLGRNLSGGAASASVPLVYPFELFEDRINQLDIRTTKIFRIKSGRLQANFDIYNVFNASPVLAMNTTYNAAWPLPTQILDARMFKVGLQYEF